MNKPFTKMLAELNIYIGNKRISPSSSTEIDALDDDKKDPVGGMELPDEDDLDNAINPVDDGEDDDLDPDTADQVTDLDNTKLDLSNISLDQIIAALQALKSQQDGPKDMGGQPVEPHTDFADVDPNAPPENVNPADNRMPDDGPTDDESIPMLPGLRKSDEDEQVLRKPKLDDEDDDEDEDDDDKPTLGGKPIPSDSDDPDLDDTSNLDGGIGKDTDETQGLGPDGEDKQDGQPGDLDDNQGDENSDQPDENHMGSIRTVKGAHLVYKRQEGDGTFSELWQYNIGDHVNDAIGIKKAILAGTDIPDDRMRSEDGSQTYELVTLGNAQLIKITGLPN